MQRLWVEIRRVNSDECIELCSSTKGLTESQLLFVFLGRVFIIHKFLLHVLCASAAILAGCPCLLCWEVLRLQRIEQGTKRIELWGNNTGQDWFGSVCLCCTHNWIRQLAIGMYMSVRFCVYGQQVTNPILHISLSPHCTLHSACYALRIVLVWKHYDLPISSSIELELELRSNCTSAVRFKCPLRHD